MTEPNSPDLNNFVKASSKDVSSQPLQTKAEDFFLTKDISALGEVSLKDRVHVLLLRLGKSQNWLAREVGVNEGTISKILNNHWQPTAEVKLNLAKALQCDTIVLFGATPYWLDYEKSFREVKK